MLPVEKLLKMETPTDDSICDVIFEAVRTRKSENVSQEDLANKAGVTVEDLQKLESFQFNVSLETFSRVLSALNIRLEVKI